MTELIVVGSGERCTANQTQSVELAKADTKNPKRKRGNYQGKRVVFEGPDGPCDCIVKGRDLWALRALLDAGLTGVTPIEYPAPRWSAYIYNLRELGLTIETVHEPHSGPFPGTHGRYILRSGVTLIKNGEVAA